MNYYYIFYYYYYILYNNVNIGSASGRFQDARGDEGGGGERAQGASHTATNVDNTKNIITTTNINYN